MRILALLLLLANIIFFAWQQHHLPWLPIQPDDIVEKQHVVAADPVDARLLPLRLLSEYEPTAEELAAIDTPPRRLREAHPSSSSPTVATAETTETETTGFDLGLAKIFSRVAERATETQAVVIPVEDPKSDINQINETEAATLSTNDLIASEEPFTPLDPTEIANAEDSDLSANLSADSGDSEMDTGLDSSSDSASESTSLRVASTDDAGEKLALADPPVLPLPVSELPQTTPAVAAAPKKADPPPRDPAPTPARTTTSSPVSPALAKATPPVISTGGSICYKIGPYEQSAWVNAAAQWFNQRQAGSAKVSRRATPILESTAVYLPPFANRQAAEQAKKRLEQQGIQDYYINKDHSIALGVYRDPLSVPRRLAELKNKGFNNVKTQPRHRSETHYWLDVKLPRSQQNLINQFDRSMKSPEVQTASCS